MSSPIKPLVKMLTILGFLLGSGIDFDKLKESGGIVFQRSKFWFIKLCLIYFQPVTACSILAGCMFMKKMK